MLMLAAIKRSLLPVFLFILFVAGSVFFERTFSPTFKQCIGGHNQNEQSAAAEKHPSFFGATVDSYVRCTGGFIEDNSEAITALATIIIAVFTGTLWIATSKQAKLTREAFTSDKRAFVFASGLNYVYEPRADGLYNWRIRPLWSNTGETATKKLKILTGYELRDNLLPEDFKFEDRIGPGGGFLGPKTTAHGGQIPYLGEPALTPEDLSAISKGSKFLYMWGWVRYYDIFPGTAEHLTRFCWMIFPNGDPLAFKPGIPPPNPGSLTFDNLHMSFGNCADEECSY
jgi:hypothetical protein